MSHTTKELQYEYWANIRKEREKLVNFSLEYLRKRKAGQFITEEEASGHYKLQRLRKLEDVLGKPFNQGLLSRLLK